MPAVAGYESLAGQQCRSFHANPHALMPAAWACAASGSRSQHIISLIGCRLPLVPLFVGSLYVGSDDQLQGHQGPTANSAMADVGPSASCPLAVVIAWGGLLTGGCGRPVSCTHVSPSWGPPAQPSGRRLERSWCGLPPHAPMQTCARQLTRPSALRTSFSVSLTSGTPCDLPRWWE